MILKKFRVTETRTVISIGLFLLVLANLSRWLLPRTGLLGPDAVDGVQGFFLGMAITMLLVGFWKRGRGIPPGCSPTAP